MNTVIFSANLEIREDDIVECRTLLQKFFMEKAEARIAEYYRPKSMGTQPTKDIKDTWVLLGDRAKIGELDEQTFNELLDSIKIRTSFTSSELLNMRKLPFTITIPISSIG